MTNDEELLHNQIQLAELEAAATPATIGELVSMFEAIVDLKRLIVQQQRIAATEIRPLQSYLDEVRQQFHKKGLHLRHTPEDLEARIKRTADNLFAQKSHEVSTAINDLQPLRSRCVDKLTKIKEKQSSPDKGKGK